MTETIPAPHDDVHDDAGTTSADTNEILATARVVRDRALAAADATVERTRHWPLAKIGVGVGIGSAAIAAAVLFANRKREG